MYDCFKPGKIWYDTSGKRIQAHGGSIIFAENKFWWYGENKDGITGTATGEVCPFWHHGVKIYSSTDLYNWTDEGFCVVESDDKNNPFHPVNLMDRPHILYNEKTGNYVLWAKTTKDGDFGNCTFSVCVGKSLKNMKFVKEILPTPFHAGDFDLFKFKGKAYVVYENPHTEMVAQELTDNYEDLTDKFSSHLHAPCPPFVREAPVVFEYKDRLYMITSGTTGYYPNSSEIADITDIHGEWKVLGKVCVGDKNDNSFHSQFSSVFKHPTKENLYIALGDRWLVDLPEDLPDMNDVFYKMCGPNPTAQDLSGFSDENTSVATYVWLPVLFDENDRPFISWQRKWSV
ncbi:MAG: family 43 glycosylhydrolase [Clostridia bacterium]|nr:family 43 glycosylhydrolase [Clostridia bacterium]